MAELVVWPKRPAPVTVICSVYKKKMATFDLSFDFQQPDEETLEVLIEVFADDNIFEEITSTEHDVLTASTSTTNAIQDLNQTLAEDHNENIQPPRSEKKRFKTVSEEELRELQERKQSISTKKNTKWSVRLFQGDLSYKKSIPLFPTHQDLNLNLSCEHECFPLSYLSLEILIG